MSFQRVANEMSWLEKIQAAAFLKEEIPKFFSEKMMILLKRGELGVKYTDSVKITFHSAYITESGKISARIKIFGPGMHDVRRSYTTTENEWIKIT